MAFLFYANGDFMKKISTLILLLPIILFSQKNERDTIFVLNPVLVTAQQATERETPASFSNISRKKISENYSMQDVPVLIAEQPSMISYSDGGNGIGYNYVVLRGFDQKRLSVMINGIPQNDPEDHNVYWIDFPDLLSSTQDIQIQRGAGSSFYGPPAIGGSINLIANPFEQKQFVRLESIFGFQEYGSDNTLPNTTRKLSATINSGLLNNELMLYGKIGNIRSSGYRDRAWIDMNSFFVGMVKFTENTTTRLHFFGGPLKDGLVYLGLPKNGIKDKSFRRKNFSWWSVDPAGNSIPNIERRKEEVENFSQPHYEILHEWKIKPNLTLHNTIFYVQGDGRFIYDASWADTSMLRIGYNYGIPTKQNPTETLVEAFVNIKQVGWYPRVEIKNDKNELNLGAEIRFHDALHGGKINSAINLPNGFDPNYIFYQYNGIKKMGSLYVNDLFRFSDELSFMANTQIVFNEYKIEKEKYIGTDFKVPYYFINPRFGLNYNFSDEVNYYFSISHTSREPRMRNLYAAEDSYFGAMPQFKADTSNGNIKYDFKNPYAKPENLLDLEIGAGYKSDKIKLNGNFYWMDFKNELIKSGQVDIFGQAVTGNAKLTRHIGIEFAGEYLFNNYFSLNGNFGYSNNRLIDYNQINDSGKIINYNGNPIAGFPDFVSNLRLNYNNENYYFSFAGKYVGGFYTDNSKNDDFKNDAYFVFNSQFVYKFNFNNMIFNFRLEVNNLTNELYSTSGEGDAFFPAAERNYIFGVNLEL